MEPSINEVKNVNGELFPRLRSFVKEGLEGTKSESPELRPGIWDLGSLNLQNISIFTIAVSSLCSFLYYNFASGGGAEGIKPYDMLLPVVGVHATVDFFVTKTYDLKLHHLCIGGIIFYNCYYNVSSETRFLFSYPLINTEISSIFYVLKYWLPPKTVLANVNTALFYLSFAKYRIVDFYDKIIQPPVSSFDIVFSTYSPTNPVMSGLLLASCYGLYMLNIYWFMIMNKMLYKMIFITPWTPATSLFSDMMASINTDKMCQQLCSYLHWINIPLAGFIYAYQPHEKNILDIAGITTLSVSSYLYHHDIYQRLHNQQIQEYNVPTHDNIVLFFNDTLCIHLRSMLVVATHYYNSSHGWNILCFSGTVHLASTYCSVINMMDLLGDPVKNKNTFSYCHDILTAIPVFCDCIMVYRNSSYDVAIPFLWVNITILLLFVVNPFYKLSHVGFHVLLLFQTYYMSKGTDGSPMN